MGWSIDGQGVEKGKRGKSRGEFVAIVGTESEWIALHDQFAQVECGQNSQRIKRGNVVVCQRKMK